MHTHTLFTTSRQELLTRDRKKLIYNVFLLGETLSLQTDSLYTKVRNAFYQPNLFVVVVDVFIISVELTSKL